MRSDFVQGLCQLAARDERVMLLTADLGWSVLEPFQQQFPTRFINVGVAEQNMLGIATGLAIEGHLPFVYSIATFASMRCYEQFRNGPLLHRLPVRVIGIGGGFSYGHAGPTHYAVEDLTLFRTQAGVAVMAPVDGAQARSALERTRSIPGPVYLRIDKNPTPELSVLAGRCELGRAERVRAGRDLLILATGSITHEALQAAELLWQRHGVSAEVAAMAHLPFEPSPQLMHLLSQHREVLTVEEGSVVGGLGSLVAEGIAEAGLSARLQKLGVRRPLTGVTGSVDYMRRLHGIDAGSVVKAATSRVERRAA